MFYIAFNHFKHSSQVIYATREPEGSEMVMMEISDGTYFVPAIFKPNDVREKFGY